MIILAILILAFIFTKSLKLVLIVSNGTINHDLGFSIKIIVNYENIIYNRQLRLICKCP
jgi:hypothetical protein